MLWDNYLSRMSFSEAVSLLRNPASPQTDKRRAIHFLELHRSSNALMELSKAIETYRDNEEVVRDIIRAFRNIKRTGPLSSQPVYSYSVVGLIIKIVYEFFSDRDWIDVITVRPYDQFKIAFKFPDDRPFVEMEGFISSLYDVFRRKHIRASIEIENMNDDSTEGVLLLCLEIEMQSLTEFWRTFGGTYDFPKDRKGYYRPFTKAEIVRKVEQRARSILLGMDPSESEYQAVARYVYGDGTEETPGLFNIIRSPTVYGDKDLIVVESYDMRELLTGNPRSHNRCSYFEMQKLGKANPFFTQYIHNTFDGVQRWIYLARAAGSVFSTAYMERIMNGLYDDTLVFLSNVMFFVSKDTMGVTRAVELNTEINKLTGLLDHFDYEMGEDVLQCVQNYTAVRLAMFAWLRKRYYHHIEVDIAGRTAFLSYRKCSVWRDQDHVRYESMPLFDSLGPDATPIGNIEREKKPGARVPTITKAEIIRSGESAFSLLTREEITRITSRTAFGPRNECCELQGVGSEPETIYPYAINHLFAQLEASHHLAHLNHRASDGQFAVPQVCIVDEVADGSWNTLLAFTIEELTRPSEEDYPAGFLRTEAQKRLGADFWHLRDADPYAMNEADVDHWRRLEQTLMEIRANENSVDALIFIGSTRSLGASNVEGYPCMKTANLMADFGLSEAEATQVVYSLSHGADFMPHPFMVDPDKARLLPIYGNIPVRLETRTVQIGAYLKEIILYNGIVNFYKREYKRLCVDKMLAIVEDNSYSIAAKREALEALRRFTYPEIVFKLIDLVEHCSEKNEIIKSIMEQTAYRIFEDVLHEAVILPGNDEEIVVKNIEKMDHWQNVIDRVRGCRIPRLADLAERLHEKIVETDVHRQFFAVPLSTYFETMTDEIYHLRNTRGLYVHPYISDSEHQIARELSCLKRTPENKIAILKQGITIEDLKKLPHDNETYNRYVESLV